MSWATLIFLVVVVTVGVPILAYWSVELVKARSQARSRKSPSDDGRGERLEREVAELRERVETLERIVTDGRYTLDQEFERLDPRGASYASARTRSG